MRVARSNPGTVRDSSEDNYIQGENSAGNGESNLDLKHSDVKLDI